MSIALPFCGRNYRIQERQKCCRNCKHACNGGFVTNPLQCQHPVELERSITHGERIEVHPLGICEGYFPGHVHECKTPTETYVVRTTNTKGERITIEIDAEDKYDAASRALCKTMTKPIRVGLKRSE